MSLIGAPGSDPLLGADEIRIETSDPYRIIIAELDESAVAFEFDASDELSTLSVTAHGDDDQIVAVGTTPPLRFTGIDFELAVFMAPPMSAAAAPAELPAAASTAVSAPVPLGAVVFWSGSDGSSDGVVVYDAYKHVLRAAEDLPDVSTIARVAVADSDNGVVVIASDRDVPNQALAAWRFDTIVPPDGTYRPLTIDGNFSAPGTTLAPLGDQTFILNSTPLGYLDREAGTLEVLPAAGELAGQVVSANDGYALLVGTGAGDTGVTLLSAHSAEALGAPSSAKRTGHSAVALDDDALIIGGELDGGSLTDEALYYVGSLHAVESRPEFLATPRKSHTAVATEQYILVAGGIDEAGEGLSSIEIFDRRDLRPVATVSMAVARALPALVPLGNGQILIAGGRGVEDEPIAGLELLTLSP